MPPQTRATIPLTTQQPGTTTYGPFPVATGANGINVTFDRTVAGGLNSLSSSTTLTIHIQVAFVANPVDNADPTLSDWKGVCGLERMPGGLYDLDGNPLPSGNPGGLQTINSAYSQGTLEQPTNANRQVRAVVTVEGPSAVALAGSVTLS